MVRKKAQLKIQQMAIMLLVVTIFFVMIGLLVLSITTANFRTEAEQIREYNALTLANKISNSPELRCGEAFGGTKINCIDLDKAIILKEKIDMYEINSKDTFWGRDVNIKISRLYPEVDNVPCTSTAIYPNCKYIEMFKNTGEVTASNFVLLCRKASEGNSFYDKCEIGEIEVGYKEWNQE